MTDPLLLSYAEQSRSQIDQPPPAKPAPVPAMTLPSSLKADSRHRIKAHRLSKVAPEERLSFIAKHQQAEIIRQAA